MTQPLTQDVPEHQKLYIRKQDGTVEHRYTVPDAQSWGQAVYHAMQRSWDLTGLTLHPQNQPLES